MQLPWGDPILLYVRGLVMAYNEKVGGDDA